MWEVYILVCMGKTAEQKELCFSKQVDKSCISHLDSSLWLEKSPAAFQIIYL